MKEIVCDQFGNKSVLSTYFILYDDLLFYNRDFDIESDFADCFYVKKLGSNIEPRIYVSEKKNNEWISDEVFLGGYESFANFIVNHRYSIICIRGFSPIGIEDFVSVLNKVENMDVKILRWSPPWEIKAVIREQERNRRIGSRLTYRQDPKPIPYNDFDEKFGNKSEKNK